MRTDGRGSRSTGGHVHASLCSTAPTPEAAAVATAMLRALAAAAAAACVGASAAPLPDTLWATQLHVVERGPNDPSQLFRLNGTAAISHGLTAPYVTCWHPLFFHIETSRGRGRCVRFTAPSTG